MHYLDEGPKDAPVMLLIHGMPTWSYLYRDFIPKLVAAGYRCIAPDHLGFGKSDKPKDPYWYSIARHTEVLTSLITELDLGNITLVCQDWGGPIGLAQSVTMPERFSRLLIMNTWLHHPEFYYSEAIKRWNQGWKDGGLFAREKPNVGVLVALSAGLVARDVAIPALVSGSAPDFPTPLGKIFTMPTLLLSMGFRTKRITACGDFRFPFLSIIIQVAMARRRLCISICSVSGLSLSILSGAVPTISLPKPGVGNGRQCSIRRPFMLFLKRVTFCRIPMEPKLLSGC